MRTDLRRRGEGMSTLAAELLAGYSALNQARKQILTDEAARLLAQEARGISLREDDERAGAAMLAHAIMNDDQALGLLAHGHDDPARLAVAVAQAAVTVLGLIARRPDQCDLFELERAYLEASWLAMDGAAAQI